MLNLRNRRRWRKKHAIHPFFFFAPPLLLFIMGISPNYRSSAEEGRKGRRWKHRLFPPLPPSFPSPAVSSVTPRWAGWTGAAPPSRFTSSHSQREREREMMMRRTANNNNAGERTGVGTLMNRREKEKKKFWSFFLLSAILFGEAYCKMLIARSR